MTPLPSQRTRRALAERAPLWARLASFRDATPGKPSQVGVPIAFLQLQWSLITLVVMERENRVKEMMLMMGLREPAYW